MDDVDDVGKLPAHRSPRPIIARTLSTRSSSNKKTKHAWMNGKNDMNTQVETFKRKMILIYKMKRE